MRPVGVSVARTLCRGFVCLGCMVGASGTAMAQVNTGRITFGAGVDVSHAYLFRGISQERDGLVLQPYADMTFSLLEGDQQGLHSASVTIGQWNSLHSGPTGSDGSAANVKMWYESDFYTSLALGIDNWEVGLAYTSYLSPNDSFGTVKELAIGLTMDDRELLGNFALSPHALLAIEMDGQRDAGAAEGVYLEVGAEPGVSLENLPVRVSFPVTLGFSLSDYYEHPAVGDAAFGFFSVGMAGAVPLNVAASLGTWEVNGRLSLYALGDTLEVFNGGDGFQPVATFGLSLSY